MIMARNDRIMGFHPVRQLSPSVFFHVYYALGSEPLGGTVIVVDICRHSVDSVYLTGLQCFVSDKYPDGETPNRPENDVVPYHNFKWLRSFVRQCPDRIKVDDYMNYAFNKY